MTPESWSKARWSKLEELYHAARELAPGERSAFLANSCRGDDELKRRIEVMLAQDSNGRILDGPAAEFLSSVSPGDQLGPYKILSFIGAGGMGEVWKARDTRLDRLVAIKISKEQYSDRFEREARAVAALNHPHICQIYDVGPHYLVMEYVEGAPLKGPLPLDRALVFATQLAGALHAAHFKGVVHRDLKPGNVMLTKSGVKVLDFGLAKIEPPGPKETTVTQITQAGAIMGTLPYMSPEQVQGIAADARSDIFALGLILYEMLTGRPAFRGANQASLMAAILHTEPEPMTGVPATATPGVERILKRCLAKDPDDRWQSARDLMFELESVGEPQAGAISARRIWPWVLTAVMMMALAAAGGFEFARGGRYGGSGLRDWTMDITPPVKNGFGFNTPEISPDGTMIAAYTAGGIAIRRLGTRQFIPLRGTQGAQHLFWSPDSQWIAFGNSLSKVRVPDGAPEPALEVPGHSRGGTWGRNGDLLVATEQGLWIGSAQSGGRARQIMPYMDPKGLFHPVYPHFLPDGEHFIFSALDPDRIGDEFSGHGIYLAAWSGGQWKQRPVLLKPNLNEARYSPAHGGCLLYVQNDNLYAQRLNLRQAKLERDPELVEKGVSNSLGAEAKFSVSRDGALAWFPGSALLSQLTWFDRQGKPLGTTGPGALYYYVALSPDERRVAATVHQGEALETRVMEAGKSGFLKIAATSRTAGVGFAVVWSRDGEHVLHDGAHLGTGRGSPVLYEQSVSGAVEPKALRPFPWYLFDTTADGRRLLIADPAHRLMVLPTPGDDGIQSKPLLQSNEMVVQGAISPDGDWVAYESAGQIFVQRSPVPRDRRQISVDGGQMPVWRADGKEILYHGTDGRLWSVPAVPTRGEFGTPVPLFAVHWAPGVARSRIYAVTHDGSRILVAEAIPQPESKIINVAADWEAELRKASR